MIGISTLIPVASVIINNMYMKHLNLDDFVCGMNYIEMDSSTLKSVNIDLYDRIRLDMSPMSIVIGNPTTGNSAKFVYQSRLTLVNGVQVSYIPDLDSVNKFPKLKNYRVTFIF